METNLALELARLAKLIHVSEESRALELRCIGQVLPKTARRLEELQRAFAAQLARLSELEAGLARAVEAYWAAGGPGKGSGAFWALLEELREEYGPEAVEDARERLELAQEGACEMAEGQREEERRR
jgi:hypothetical protein